ncbi:DUF3768 domain-containing protein [Sphingomonas sp. BK235]|uniref:DUF3768 domain-containing protein n=1 Tax=Sphingomonas sp. BK235 TaxID=2512131 RepID=UPI0010D89E02|nr:DUF3768 domain-containing protein [Sphingomonas sp. BK235]TCP30366.1 uncharacterized protein DUF3768 [Sphingomonas sp. BK235]
MDNVVRPSRTKIIGALNDRCRKGLDRRARIVMTRACLATFAEAGVSTLVAQIEILAALRAHTFDSGDLERHRGEFELRGHTIYFAIDYYDLALEYGSEDPADAAVTRRVLTIMVREDL